MASISRDRQIICIRGVNLNSVADTAFFVPFGKFNVISVKASNASVDMTASAAQLALYVGPGATGTAIVAAAANLTGLTAATKVASLTVASTDTTTATVVNSNLKQLYLRTAVVHGAAATCDVQVEIGRWP